MKLRRWTTEYGRRHHVLLSILACLIVFVTVYALVLPAITLDRDTAQDEPGITAETVEETGDDTGIVTGEPQTADPEETEPEETAESEPSEDETGAEGLTEDESEPEAGPEEPEEPEEPAEIPEVTTFDATAGELHIHAETPASALPEGTRMEAETVRDRDVISAISDAAIGEGEEVTFVSAVEISFISPEGDAVEPAEPGVITVTSEDIAQNDTVSVVQVTEGEPAVIPAESTDEQVVFETETGSVFGIVGTTIEKTVITSDGHNYKITVSYGPDAGVPEGAQLEVEEILQTEEATDGATEYETYLAKTREALGIEAGVFEYARIFDIRITDALGQKVEITAPVDVKIELADKQNGTKAENSTQVVHFASGTEEAQVVSGLNVDGEEVSFQAEGFSAYAIVEGPNAVDIGWARISSAEDLLTIGSEGVYMGHPEGFYYGNTLVTENNRTGVTKTKPAQTTPPTDKAALYYFEPVSGAADQVYIYCYAPDGMTKQYLYNNNNNSLSFAPTEADRTAFTFHFDSNSGTFKFNHGKWYMNMQGGANGKRFCCFGDNANDVNNNLYLWYPESTTDPYGLDGATYGLMNWGGGVAGKALMASSSQAGALDAKALTVMSTANDSSRLFAPNESDISMWTFHWIDADKYYVTAVADGSTKYLRIDSAGLSLVSEPDDHCKIKIVPGSGIHAGQIHLNYINVALTYSGSASTGFSVGGSVGSEWLYLVELSELTEDYFMTYSAQKISVSDPTITNGSRVIVYTRSWNDTTKRYDYYAISSNGAVIPVYESGETIEWVSGQINKLLWSFTEYMWEGTNEPNNYYDLYNQYSERYLAPQVTGGQILAEVPIGVILGGRADGRYSTTILAWDDPYYAYVGYKVENGHITTCPTSEAMEFFFAVMQDLNVDDDITTVPTVEHTQYGITMKMKNFDTRTEMSDFLGNNDGGMGTVLHQGLLSTNLIGGYPTTVGGSLGTLFAGAQEVNHLFVQKIYDESGYFEYDSAQNFASLQGRLGGDFAVYKELGTYDSVGSRGTLQHGQFFPYNDLVPGLFSAVNPKNLTSTTMNGQNPVPLSDSDPRKYESLYLIEHDGQLVDTYFGMELEASFTQTPSGLDAWGHDIIFEFTGDDDFWLYVDGELVIDLGGIHSAVPGSVNFRTGDVSVNGRATTLREVFRGNFLKRKPTATEAEISAFLNTYFEGDGTVFRNYTNHTMKIFYFERGAGSSNLHMRFNLAAVRQGTVQLTKELSGVDVTETVLSEFPYQVYYRMSEEPGAEEFLLDMTDTDPFVYYYGSITPVKHLDTVSIDGVTYEDVFFLKPHETAEISFPDGTTSYRIVECGVSTDIFEGVTANTVELTGIPRSAHRSDYGIGFDTMDNRPKVNYVNEVKPDALSTMRITMSLYAEDGVTQIHYPYDKSVYTFRLYLGTEFSELDTAYMYTYHVLDPQGRYCEWDFANQTFKPVGNGTTDYSTLTPAEKLAASFSTSIYGSISKIPVDYTVEIRDMLAGTTFKVQERPWEIPDGYSFQKYIYNGTELAADAETGVTDTVTAGTDPDIIVCNTTGWGLRVNKVWSDKDYMTDRDPTYFAVYTGTDLTLIPGTLRQMSYDTTSQYWYWAELPVDGVPFEGYEVREAKITAGTPVADDDGVVTNEDSLTFEVLEDGDEIPLHGYQKGETSQGTFTYTVRYEEEVIQGSSRVRIIQVTNDRPGIILRKQDRNGDPVPGATFTLTDSGGGLVGTFMSDAEGMITTAFLGEGIDYTLTETVAPQGYYGLQEPMTIRTGGGTVTVSGASASDYILTQAQADESAELILKNRPYVLKAVKQDGDTELKLAGVHFALHKQVTVGGVTMFDLNPMPGYEDLVTTADGVIPRLDSTLPAGTYQLREMTVPEGYRPLPGNGYTEFTVSKAGKISLLTQADWVTLTEEIQTADGPLNVNLTILNYLDVEVGLHKVDGSGSDLTGAKFRLYKYQSAWEAVAEYSEIDLTETATGQLEHLSVGRYRLEEILAPEGCVIRDRYVYFRIAQDGTVTLTDKEGTGANENPDASISSDVITVKNNSGSVLPHTGGAGTPRWRLCGFALILTALAAFGSRIRRKGREERSSP